MSIFDVLKKKDSVKQEINDTNEQKNNAPNDIISCSEMILYEENIEINTANSIRVPIIAMAGIGGAVAEIMPSLRTVTQTMSMDSTGLYRIANMGVGDSLKLAKNGNKWGAFKTADGKSKMVQLQEAGPLTANTNLVQPIDPATLMMGAVLISLEQKLNNIEEMQREIKAFLVEEKQSNVEGNLNTLIKALQDYKFNWEKENYRTNHHKQVLDVKRECEQDLLFYRKQVEKTLQEKHVIINKGTIESVSSKLYDDLKYYRMSLYVNALASYIEVMLLDNFEEKYINHVKENIEKDSLDYREIFTQCSLYLEKVAGASLGSKTLDGIGTVGNVLGDALGNVPLIQGKKIDEWLHQGGSKFKDKAQETERISVQKFATLSEPGTRLFVERLEEINWVYNRTTDIYFDRENVYFVEG